MESASPHSTYEYFPTVVVDDAGILQAVFRRFGSFGFKVALIAL
jgi:hypothetical protein